MNEQGKQIIKMQKITIIVKNNMKVLKRGKKYPLLRNTVKLDTTIIFKELLH